MIKDDPKIDPAKQWIQYVRLLLINPNDKAVRALALNALTEVFEDDGMEHIKP